ncbi:MULTISPECIES: DMT family transporter [Sphingomonas]|uniref:S-adenosylmethionine uptake transporter n=1 Tax=Sphingomonas leidyi TaxID=68569 RepID=A0A7X5ZX62_9SPHN|nr:MULTISPECIES: DMT family transporter [Sphingomonas]MBN8813523.1 DMT family transporter [Sphingomonas sp.]NIJ66915.1 S-adenosylmethionine uptake transporter [Sphingomonas leidyi]OJY52420.1 MAG: permease [Sphingomonas sp. 67-41]
MARATPILAALLAACAGIALYSIMDAVMKGLSLAIGAYAALFWRLVAGAAIMTPLFAFSRPRLPARRVLAIHAIRSAVMAVMAIAFFWGIARVPLAEAIALTFIAPLIALALAAIFLKERIGPRSVLGSLLGLAGVGIILAGQLGAPHRPDSALGMAAVLVSAVFYAVNLVIARHQAQRAGPIEIAFFQNWLILALFALPAPWLLAMPVAGQWPLVVLAAALAITSLLLLSWAYARAEAQVLLSVEYTAFVWAALMGWLFFREPLTMLTIAGTLLIVAGCWMAARSRPGIAEPEVEPALS